MVGSLACSSIISTDDMLGRHVARGVMSSSVLASSCDHRDEFIAASTMRMRNDGFTHVDLDASHRQLDTSSLLIFVAFSCSLESASAFMLCFAERYVISSRRVLMPTPTSVLLQATWSSSSNTSADFVVGKHDELAANQILSKLFCNGPFQGQ